MTLLIRSVLSLLWRYWFAQFYLICYDATDSITVILSIVTLLIRFVLSYPLWRYWFNQFYLTHYDITDSLSFILSIMTLLIHLVLYYPLWPYWFT